MAEEFPSARVIGTDLSPIQPHWNPPNCEFHVEDLEDELRPWTTIYKDADLIHTRSLLQTLRKPTELVNNIFQYVLPPHPLNSENVTLAGHGPQTLACSHGEA